MACLSNRWAAGLILLAVLSLSACAASRTLYVYPRYSGQPTGRVAGTPSIGLQSFADRRLEKADYVGMRYLGGGRRETYVTGSGSLAGDLTAMVKAYAGAKGYHVRDVSGWEYAPEDVAALGQGLRYVVGGEVTALEVDAVRRFGRSEMVLTLEVVFYVGDVAAKSVTRRPVKARIERTDPVFDARRLEHHLNAALAETIATGLTELP